MVEEVYPPIVMIDGNQALLQISTATLFVAEHHISQLFTLYIADQHCK